MDARRFVDEAQMRELAALQGEARRHRVLVIHECVTIDRPCNSKRSARLRVEPERVSAGDLETLSPCWNVRRLRRRERRRRHELAVDLDHRELVRALREVTIPDFE